MNYRCPNPTHDPKDGPLPQLQSTGFTGAGHSLVECPVCKMKLEIKITRQPTSKYYF